MTAMVFVTHPTGWIRDDPGPYMVIGAVILRTWDD